MVESTHITVFGALGMLGSDLVPMLKKKGYTVLALDKKQIDITDHAAVQKIPATDMLINCAAYTAVDAAEKERELCRAVNVQGTQHLVSHCKKHNIPFLFISTDYVFSGETKGYNEDAETDPINYYGETKAEAEKIVQTLDNYWIVRTSWLFGTHGKNFVETVRNICTKKGRIRVVNDQLGSPTATTHLAQAICTLLKKPSGIYHCTASGSCTWYDFAKAICDAYDLNAIVEPIPTSAYPTLARRPRYSILNNNKGDILPHWKEGLQHYIEETR